MNPLAKVFIDFQLISDNISERWLIPIEILAITTLLAVVEGEIGLISSWIEALIQTKTIVGVPNKAYILMDHRAIDTHMGHFSTIFTCHMSVDHFEVIEARIFKFFHEKINLGGEYIHLFKLVNLAGAGLSVLINPALTRSYLFNQCLSFLSTESKEWTSSSNINMFPRRMNQPMVEALDDKPLLHSVVWACSDIIQQSLPRLSNGFVCELLKAWDLVLKGIGHNQWKELDEKCIGALLQGGHNFLVDVEPLLCLPQ
jgi:hypothetical protein